MKLESFSDRQLFKHIYTGLYSFLLPIIKLLKPQFVLLTNKLAIILNWEMMVKFWLHLSHVPKPIIVLIIIFPPFSLLRLYMYMYTLVALKHNTENNKNSKIIMHSWWIIMPHSRVQKKPPLSKPFTWRKKTWSWLYHYTCFGSLLLQLYIASLQHVWHFVFNPNISTVLLYSS